MGVVWANYDPMAVDAAVSRVCDGVVGSHRRIGGGDGGGGCLSLLLKHMPVRWPRPAF